MLDGIRNLSVVNMVEGRLDVFNCRANRSSISSTNRQNFNIVGIV